MFPKPPAEPCRIHTLAFYLRAYPSFSGQRGLFHRTFGFPLRCQLQVLVLKAADLRYSLPTKHFSANFQKLPQVAIIRIQYHTHIHTSFPQKLCLFVWFSFLGVTVWWFLTVDIWMFWLLKPSVLPTFLSFFWSFAEKQTLNPTTNNYTRYMVHHIKRLWFVYFHVFALILCVKIVFSYFDIAHCNLTLTLLCGIFLLLWMNSITWIKFCLAPELTKIILRYSFSIQFL